jgi:hypothetical protein
MILPTKHISAQQCMLGVGAILLRNIASPQTVTSLWERVREEPEVNAYWRFILALDFLFALEALDHIDGMIVRRKA